MTTKNLIDAFAPHPLLRHHLLQTVVSVWRPSTVEWLLDEEEPLLIDAGEDLTGHAPNQNVRMLAYYSRASRERLANGGPCIENKRRGLVLMLHGWRGCSHSPYNVVVTERLVRAGFDVMRLNLRDHGPGIHYSAHELNRGAFLGTLIEEVETATHRIAEMAGDSPFYIVGPSMGGNFAMRLAIRHAQRPIPNLRHVVAISPAINPASATDALDSNFIYRQYFRRSWLRSVRAKTEAFPEEFGILAEIEAHSTVRQMTDWAIPKISHWSGADEYFYHYSVHLEDIQHINVGTTIITAKDDPVIPAKDFEGLPTNPYLQTHITDYGGHVGYVNVAMKNSMPRMYHCLPKMILSTLERA